MQECAGGVILDEDDGWNVVALGHPMIFPLDDKLAPSIDWDTAETTELIGEKHICFPGLLVLNC